MSIPDSPAGDEAIESADDLTLLRARILAVPFLEDLPSGLRERFAMIILWISTVRAMKIGEQIYLEGDQDNTGGCLLLEGGAEIIREGFETEAVPAPSLLGEIQQFTEDKHRTATVRVVEPARTLVFAWEDLAEMASRVFTDEERDIISVLLKQVAWGRCADLFDQAAGISKVPREG